MRTKLYLRAKSSISQRFSRMRASVNEADKSSRIIDVIASMINNRTFVASWMLCLLASWIGTLPASAVVLGNVDNIGNGQISGWAVDTSVPATSINVAVYLDGPKGTGRNIGFVATNILRNDVNNNSSISGNHGFSWSLPTLPTANGPQALHIYYVYGVDNNGNYLLITNSPAVFPKISAGAVGTPQIVFNYQQNKCASDDIPDHPARAFRTSDGKVNLIASHINARRAVGTSLNNVVHQCAVIHSSDNDTSFSDFSFYQWLQGTYTLDGKTIYSVTHNEWYGALVDSGCNNDEIDSWVSAMLLEVSNDGGASFRKPQNYLIRYPSTPWSNSFSCSQSAPTRYGDLGGSNILTRGGYQYKFFLYETEPSITPARAWQCIMRTNNIANASSWQFWNGSGWSAGKSTPCAALPVLQNARSVTYNKFLEMYVAIQFSTAKGFSFSISRDLLNWSAPTYISTPGLNFASTPYPSLLDPTDTSLNFEMTGQTPYLYYTQLHNGINGDLMRVPIAFTLFTGV